MQSERVLQRHVIAWLKAERIWHLKVHGGPMQRAGVPDLLLCVKDAGGSGRFVAIELKTVTGKVSPLQRHEMLAIINSGGFAITCRSLDDVREVVRWAREPHVFGTDVARILVAKQVEYIDAGLADEVYKKAQ